MYNLASECTFRSAPASPGQLGFNSDMEGRETREASPQPPDAGQVTGGPQMPPSQQLQQYEKLKQLITHATQSAQSAPVSPSGE